MRDRMREVLRKLQRDESGATAVEYALLGASIAAVIAVTVGVLGVKVNGLFLRMQWP